MPRTNTRRMHKLRDEFREQSEQANAACWICGLPIDYEASHDDYRNPDRFQLDHFHPVATHPELQEDPTNFRPSHAGCNETRGKDAPLPGLGTPSRQWA